MYIDSIKPTKQRKVVMYQETNNTIDSCSMIGKRNAKDI